MSSTVIEIYAERENVLESSSVVLQTTNKVWLHVNIYFIGPILDSSPVVPVDYPCLAAAAF